MGPWNKLYDSVNSKNETNQDIDSGVVFIVSVLIKLLSCTKIK